MINKIFAYVSLNIKSLLKDKISFVWSILLPMVMFYINKDTLNSEDELIYWWIYMLLCSYVYGVGLYALELKEAGSLRVIFSIESSSFVFFWGNLFTQIFFSMINLFLFNGIVLLFKPFSITKMFEYSMLYIIMCLPVAFLGYGFTLLARIHINSIRTLFSILIFGMFMLLNTGSTINQYNPMYYLAQILYQRNWQDGLEYIVFAGICVLIGVVGIYKFEPNSNERR